MASSPVYKYKKIPWFLSLTSIATLITSKCFINGALIFHVKYEYRLGRLVTPWVHWPVSWAEAATVSLGSGIRSLSPVLSEVEFAGLERERISNCSAKHDLSGAEAGDGAGVVPVHEDSLHDWSVLRVPV